MNSISRRKALAALAIIAAMAAVPLTQAHAAEPAGTVVLVHGAFADGSSWAKVTPQLLARNLEVIAVQLPLTSLADDVAATRRAIARATGPVTLVGHSWGGSVITEAGISERVKALVYLAAFAHEPNTNVHDIADAYPAPGLKHVVADPDGFVRLSSKGIAEFFAPQASEPEKAFLTATQGPIRGASFSEKVQNAAWKTKAELVRGRRARPDDRAHAAAGDGGAHQGDGEADTQRSCRRADSSQRGGRGHHRSRFGEIAG